MPAAGAHPPSEGFLLRRALHYSAAVDTLTSALSIRCRGRPVVPSGVITSFRPPRFLIAKGTRTERVERTGRL